ncbi:MAG: serine/threonine protein kinase [Kofleriaceae bacterium]|nr:serine/threonine protein kinase [Kofleriaceae bacterium]
MRGDDAIAQGPTLLSGSDPGATSGTDGDDDRLAAGARAGDYEIERFLGAGAMGDVYAARHPLIGKRAAVKVIKRRLAAAPEAVERFLREARAVNQVGHPRVIDVFAVGRLDDGRLYLVMDLLDGETLGARLGRGRPSLDETLAILDAVAAALDAAHARGVVHRDLKPDNVFLARGDGPGAAPAVFVLDFGIAKLLGDAGAGELAATTLTDRGSWLGTPAYMAPEQWGAEGAGPASDRYALGAMAFELLAGRPPFAATSLPQMMEKHFRAPVPSLAGTAPATAP